MAEHPDRAVVEILRYPARIAETNCHLVDDLLTLVRERGRQTGQHRLDLFGRQSYFLAPPLMRVGRVGRMPVAVDDNDGDLAFALGERVAAGVEIGPERSRGLYQLSVMHPDLARPAGRATGLDQKAIALLLFRRHLVIRDLGVAAEGRRLGHIGLPSQMDWRSILQRRTCPVDPAGALLRDGMRSAVPSEALLRTRQARRWPSRTREIGAISAKIGTSP